MREVLNNVIAELEITTILAGYSRLGDDGIDALQLASW